MVATVFEGYQGDSIEVDWMPIVGENELFPTWHPVPDAGTVHGQDISQVQSKKLDDCPMIIIPSALAAFMRPAFPMLQVKHFKLGTSGDRVLGASTFVAAEPHVNDVVMRLVKLDSSLMSIPVARFSMTYAAMQVVWDQAMLRGIGVLHANTRAEVYATLLRFYEGWQAEQCCLLSNETTQKVGLSAAVSVKTPTATEPMSAEVVNANKIAVMTDQMLVGDLLMAGDGGAVLADVWAMWGKFEQPNEREDPESSFSMMMQVLHEVVKAELAEGAKGTSALNRAKLSSAKMLVKTMAQRMRIAMKPPKFRAYEADASERYLEWCRLLDLDAVAKSHRDMAFEQSLPYMFRHYVSLKWLADETDDTTRLLAYKLLVQHFLKGDALFVEETLETLDARVAMLVSRSNNEGGTNGCMAKAHKIIEFDRDAEKEDAGAAESVTGAEAKDTSGTGRPLTKRESQEMVRLRTHSLYAFFVAMVKGLQQAAQSTEVTTSDYIRVQLEAGLPTVRRQLMCVLSMSGQPWEFLRNHRLAKRGAYKPLAVYLGSVLATDRHGNLPERMKTYEAPSWVLELLDKGLVSQINFERLYAEVCEAQSRPLESSVVDSFTQDDRYMQAQYLDKVKEVGAKLLKAWGNDDGTDVSGSWKSLMDDHKDGLEEVVGLKSGPLQRHMYDKEFGLFSRLRVALEEADENYQQFMQMSPAQILVGDSTEKVSRSLTPFIPATSKYWLMLKRSKDESEKLMVKRADHPEEYNVESMLQGAQYHGLSAVSQEGRHDSSSGNARARLYEA